MTAVSRQHTRLAEALGSFASFGTSQELSEALLRPEACDFVFGNPHEVAMPEYVDAVVRGAQPPGPDHYAYTMNLPSATAAVARSIRERLGITVDPTEVYLVGELRSQGYELIEPEGTFYILVTAPVEDDRVFFDRLAAQDVYVLPGGTFEMPGWFRISLTANDDMVERGVKGFARAIEEVHRG